MFWRIFWEVAAASALVALATIGTHAVFSLDKKQQPTIVVVEAPLGRPIICDATVQSCSTSYGCNRPKCYVRKETNK